MDLEPSLVTDTHCRYYLQGRCKHGRKGVTCQYSHPKICLRYIKRGERGCNKDKSCKFVHPKLCHKSVSDKLCLRKTCHYYHAVGTIRPNHAGYLNKDGSQKNYDHSNLDGVNSNYQFPEHATYDDFPNNAEYCDYNSCKPTYGGANHRKYDNHHHYNYSDGHYESYARPENTKDAADFLGQMVELKSQFTEMKSQQQILLESMKCIQNLWSNQIKHNVQHSYQMENQFPTYNV